MRFFYYFLFLLLISCNSSIEHKIANTFTEVKNIDNIQSFEFINESLKNKEIVILGENTHEDGKTFEVKSYLAKYLIKELGFNTLALEGSAFIDMEILNGNTHLDSLMPQNFQHEWTPWWGNIKQAQVLMELLDESKISFIGLESNPHTSLKNYTLVKLDDYLLNNDYTEDDRKNTLKKFKIINDNFYSQNPTIINIDDIEFYINLVQEIKNYITFKKSSLNEDIELLSQIFQNIETSAKILKYYHLIGGYEGENIYVNVRDKQMAENLIWYKKRNPDAKILVWIANFHGAKNISEIRYKKEDKELYNSFILFNDYLVDVYGDKVFSLAFTSSCGKVGYENIESTHFTIQPPRNTLEYELGNKKFDYAYNDFQSIKSKYPNLFNKEFNTVILGYDSKPGKWLKVFDGIFYIRENETIER